MSRTRKRLAWIRKTYGDDVWIRLVGVIAGNPMLTIYGGDPKSKRKRLQNRLNNAEALAEVEARRDPPGARYLPWLAAQIKALLARYYPTHDRWVAGGRKDGALQDEVGRYQDVMHDLARDHWWEIRDWAVADRPDLSGVSIDEAVGRARDWHAERQVDGRMDSGGRVVWKDPSGWTAQLLTTPAQLRWEADQMSHCVDTYAGSDSGILSLRDPRGKPHVTFEVEIASGGLPPEHPASWLRWLQAKGKANSRIGPKYQPIAQRFIQNMADLRDEPWDNDELGEARNAWPIWERLGDLLERFEDALDVMMIEHERQPIEQIYWSAAGYEGEISPEAVGEDTELVDVISEHWPPRIHEDDLESIEAVEEALAYAASEAQQIREAFDEQRAILEHAVTHLGIGQRAIEAARKKGDQVGAEDAAERMLRELDNVRLIDIEDDLEPIEGRESYPYLAAVEDLRSLVR